MFYLHTSNKTEKLADQLCTVISREGTPSLFTREHFLLQSRGMERMISQYLADRFGVWCNASYLLPVQFIDYLGKRIGLDMDCRVFDRDILTWRFERILRENDEPVMRPIGAYLSGEQIELKRYQLARQLANIFDQYQIMRPDQLEAWQQGRTAGRDPAELWQQHLWMKLREDAPGVMHRGELVQSLITIMQSNKELELEPLHRLFVFGVHTMPPLFLSTIYELSRRIDVHFFLLSPTREYWGDIRTRRTQLLEKLSSDQDQDSTSGDALFDHPLLAGLGRQGAHFQELLLDLVEEYEIAAESFVSPLAGQDHSVLLQLQADILQARPEPTPENRLVLATDDSVLLSSCHSRMREIMVLKDQILDWLYSDPTLGLHDIIVMAPDIQEYSQLIPAVFEDIQHDISDCHARQENRYLDGFLQFLRLFAGRYSWSDLLGLLERPEVGSSFSLAPADTELIRYWVTDAGIRWGISAEQRKQDGLHEFSSGTWRAGLERMLMGIAIDSNEPVDQVLPYGGIEGSQAELLGQLCHFVAVIERAQATVRTPKTLRQWSETFRHFCSELFDEHDQPQLHEIYGILSVLNERLALYHDSPVSFAAVRSWIENEAERKSSSGFLRGRLTFCSMLPMRSIPFRCICLLGLNESEYPKDDNFAPFDLLGQSYRHGDRSRRSDDRYQALEAILAARDILYISYIGQSVKNNETICPSVVVTELLETLENYYGIPDFTVKHPLHPYNGSYFSGSSHLFSYDEYNSRVASALGAVVHEKPSAWLTGQVNSEPKKQIDCQELAVFLAQPQSYFMCQVMGIYLKNYDVYPEEHEEFELDNLQKFNGGQTIVHGLLDGRKPEQLLKTLQAGQNWPLAAPGTVVFENGMSTISAFADAVKDSRVGQPEPGLPIDIEIDGIHLGGLLVNRYENGLLLYRYSSLKGKDVLRGWLYHLLAREVLDRPVATHVVASDQAITIDKCLGSRADLSFLVNLFADGSRCPSKLHVEPAFAYARQVVLNRGRGRRAPLAASYAQLENDLKNGYLPESAFLYQHQSVEQILDGEFEKLCLDFMVPLWDMILSATSGGAIV